MNTYDISTLNPAIIIVEIEQSTKFIWPGLEMQ